MYYSMHRQRLYQPDFPPCVKMVIQRCRRPSPCTAHLPCACAAPVQGHPLFCSPLFGSMHTKCYAQTSALASPTHAHLLCMRAYPALALSLQSSLPQGLSQLTRALASGAGLGAGQQQPAHVTCGADATGHNSTACASQRAPAAARTLQALEAAALTLSGMDSFGQVQLCSLRAAAFAGRGMDSFGQVQLCRLRSAACAGSGMDSFGQVQFCSLRAAAFAGSGMDSSTAILLHMCALRQSQPP